MAAQQTEKSKLISTESLQAKDGDCKQARLPSMRRFPMSIYFIVANEFCERFNYFGVRTILTLYLMHFVGLGPDRSTAIFHLFVVLCYFSPLLGGIIADGMLGRFWTICALSLVYCVGGVVLASTAVPGLGVIGALIGLLLIGIGTGGIKPNVCAFGADQIPAEDSELRQAFFSTFYFSINLGSLVATLCIPIVRYRVHCMGTNCYALAFGIPAVAMAISLIVFVAGKPLYRLNPPGESLVGRSVGCVLNAMRNRLAAAHPDPKKTLLAYADSAKYSPEFVRDLRQLGRLLLLYVPFPIFWALFDQMGSRWTIQASLMDGYVGAGLSILPDQMQALNSFLLLLLIPLFDCFLYPMLDKLKLPATLLKRMGIGMLLSSGAFVAAMLVQLQIEADLPVPPGPGQMRAKFVNAVPDCSVQFSYAGVFRSLRALAFSDAFILPRRLPLTGVEVKSKDCGKAVKLKDLHINPDTKANAFDIVAFVEDEKSIGLAVVPVEDMKHRKGLGLARVMLTNDSLFDRLSNSSLLMVRNSRSQFNASVSIANASAPFHKRAPVRVTDYVAMHSGFYSARLVGSNEVERIPIRIFSGSHSVVENSHGQILTLILIANHDEIICFEVEDMRANSVNVLWQIPQYALISLAEVLFAISGLTLSYTEAPDSMKSLVQALWLLCVAAGNVVVMIVSEAHFVQSQSFEFLMFALLMLLNIFLFGLLSVRYRPFIVRLAEFNLEMNPGVKPDSGKDVKPDSGKDVKPAHVESIRPSDSPADNDDGGLENKPSDLDSLAGESSGQTQP